jgi:ribosomal protein S18 acetylase RimI-like enzyme
MELTLTEFSNIPGHMRSLNILRDLSSVADLIEICFNTTTDTEDRSQVDQMRRNAHDSEFLNWAPRMIDVISLPLSGFVWEDKGKIIGNVSLVPFRQNGRRIYLIANVATHPDYRRRGIGRILTDMAMQRAREKGANALWLHVREDNPGAVQLYRDLGFRERMRRTEWYAASGTVPRGQHENSLKIRPRSTRDWDTQRNWLERAYPSDTDWYQQHSWTAFGPGLWKSIYRLITDIDASQWAIEAAGKLQGVVSCRAKENHQSYTWLAIPPRPAPQPLTNLLLHARRSFSHTHGLHLEYPVGPADQSICAAGFSPRRTLLWMESPGQQPN